MTPREIEVLRSKVLQMEGLTDLTDELLSVRVGLLLNELETRRESAAELGEWLRENNIEYKGDPVAHAVALLQVVGGVVLASRSIVETLVRQIVNSLKVVGVKL